MNAFITNKFHLYISSETLPHVSAIIYSHLQGDPMFTKRHIEH